MVFTQPGRNSVVSYTGTEFLIQIAFLIFIDQHPFLCKNMLINLGAKKFANCWAKSVLQITKKQPHLFLYNLHYGAVNCVGALFAIA